MTTAPIRSAIRTKPVRVQFALMSVDHDPRALDEDRGGDVERGRGRVAGNVDRAELELVVLGQLDPVAVAGDAARRRGRAGARCGRGSARARSRSSCPTASRPAISTHDLTCGAGDRQRVLDPAQRHAVHGERGEAAVVRVDPRAHLAQRDRDAIDGAAPDRLVAVEATTGRRAGRRASRARAASACRRCRRRCAPRGAPRSPGPRIVSVPGSAPSSTSAPSARTALSVEYVSAASR